MTVIEHRMYPWLSWALPSLAFLVMYIARVAPAAFLGDLMHDFHTDVGGIGVLASAFLQGYVFMQIPVGLLVDRFGPVPLLILASIVAIFGNTWFALSGSLAHAHIARLMLGVGSAFVFICAFKQAKLWLPDRYFALACGLTQVSGMVGAALGNGWLAVLYPGDWRLAVLWISGAWSGLLLLSALVLRPKAVPTQEGAAPMGLREMISGLYQVFFNRNSWLNGLYAGLIFLPTEVLGGWWGAYYLDHVHHIARDQAGFLIGCIFLGWAVGGAFIGYLAASFGDMRKIMMASSFVSWIFLWVALYSGYTSVQLLTLVFFMYGLSNSGLVLAYAISTDFVDPSLAGSAVAFTNVMSIVFGVLMQPLIGLGLSILSVSFSMADACRYVMAILPLSLLLATFMAYKLDMSK